MASKLRIFVLVMVAALASCSTSTSLPPAGLLAYVDDPANGCILERTIGQMQFSAKYEPVDYKIVKDLANIDSALTNASYNALSKNVKGYCYFIFKLAAANGKHPFKQLARSEQDYAKVFKYTQTLMQNDFYIESGNKKIPCALYHMEGDYNILNYSLISLAFDASGIQSGSDITLVYNDQLFQNGPVKFTYSNELLTHLPTVKLP